MSHRIESLRLTGRLAAAMLSCASAPASAITNVVCVHDGTELVNALADAANGGAHVDADNVFHLVQGTFVAPKVNGNQTRFHYLSQAATGSLTLDGGWDNDCVTQLLDATLSVIDGGGIDRTLELARTGGAIYLRWLTVQNGYLDGGTGAGLVINPGIYDPFSQHGGIVGVYDVIVRDNHASGQSGGLLIGAAKTDNWLQLENLLIVGNSADTGYGAGSVYGKGVLVSLVNNTITGNTSPAPDFNGGLRVSADDASQLDIYNSILWNNGDLSLDFDAKFAYLEYDDVDVMNVANAAPPSAIGNLALDPLFVDPVLGDFHLDPSSPLLRVTPVGDRSTLVDLDGYAVPPSGKFDLGAYQLTMFASGFEP